MFEKVTPESVGIKSENVIKFINAIEKRGANTHGLLMMRGDRIFAEGYWKPFNKDFLHRMYSETKTFVSIAIGLLEERGLISLDDKIYKYFPEKIDGELPEYLKDQTIKEMLMMATVGECSWWFASGDNDRTHLYLNDQRNTVPSGMRFKYDSAASQVLSSLVEKLTGKKLLDYLKEKIFNKIGSFKTATILKTPNGDSWGDSGLLCTLRDMASFGRLLMNNGVWNGERLISKDYLSKAMSKLIDNRSSVFYSADEFGYGYQIWRVCGNGFALIGMGLQLTLCYPDKDIIVVITSDNQGNEWIKQLVLNGVEDFILDTAVNGAIEENIEEQRRLENILNSLDLKSLKGLNDSPLRKQIDGKTFVCSENTMGMKEFSFSFESKTKGMLKYVNAQGEKILPFGINCNEFGKFPQTGYSNEYGAVKTTDGFTYRDAVSLAWFDQNKIGLFVQIIDKYFGNVGAIFTFHGDKAYATFKANGENFLNEYRGELVATRKD